MEQYTQQWRNARSGRLTASMAGAILGIDPNCTREQMMRRLCAEWQGQAPEFTGNVATNWGHAHEENARRILSMDLEFAEIENGSFAPHGEWLGASPDGYVVIDEDLTEKYCLSSDWIDARCVVEIKCPYSMSNTDKEKEFKIMGNGELGHYYAQVQMQMYCAELAHTVFFQWAPNKRQIEFITFDAKFVMNKLLPALNEFYQEYMQRRELSVDYVPPEIEELILQYDDLVQSIEMAETKKKEVLAEIVRMSGEKNAEYNGRKLSKVVKAGSISYAKALKKYAPDADVEPFRGVPVTYWRLT